MQGLRSKNYGRWIKHQTMNKNTPYMNKPAIKSRPTVAWPSRAYQGPFGAQSYSVYAQQTATGQLSRRETRFKVNHGRAMSASS